MTNIPKTYSVESVTNGHPDKICDQISDAILDECMRQDPYSRVAIETFGSHGLLVIGGELTSKAEFNAAEIARDIYRSIGYRDELRIITEIVKQSADIALGVDIGGAGDQGIMYGYACDETPEFLPLGIVLVHRLTQGLEKLRKKRELIWLEPDGKAQITIVEGKIKVILVSAQHEPGVSHKTISKQLIEYLIGPVIGNIKGIKILVNPTGKFINGGFSADTGLTGRKIMVDTYGGIISHGGGCFSGKDPTKVDRSGAYMARFAAKQLVFQGFAKQCLVSVAYAIGRKDPLMVKAVNEKGEDLSGYLNENYNFQPQAIIDRLKLQRPIYFPSACYGHFGKQELPWEELEK